MSKVRLVIAQGPNQMLYSLSVLRYLEASGEYKEYEEYEDILILGGYRADPKLTEACLQISQIWNFQSRVILHGFHYLCLDNSLDFVSAAELLKRILNLQSVDVIFTLRNWQFINEIFLYAYPNARKICYGELGWLDFSSHLWSNFYGSPPMNPSGEFIPIDEAYPVLVPVDADNAYEQCPVRLVEADFFKSVIYDSSKQIQGLSEYCARIAEQLGNSITFVLTSYDTEAGYTKSYQDEIECYLSCVLPHTLQGEALIVKGHPRESYNQSQLLAEKLRESGRNAFAISEFTQVPIELFVPFLAIERVIAPMSSACITLGLLGASELVIGFGEDLIRKYMSPKCQETILIAQYQRALEVDCIRQHKFEPIKYLEFKEHFKEYSKQPIYIRLYEQNIPEISPEEFSEKTEFINRLLSLVDQYRREPLKPSLLNELRHLKKQMAQLWLDTEENLLERVYLSKFGEAHQALLNSGMQDELLIETEQNFVTEVFAQVAKGFNEPKAIQYLLVVMLYYRPHQLPLVYDLTCIPGWLFNDFFEFAIKPPLYFQKIGEANSYYQYMQKWINYLHRNILSNSESKLWHDVASHFTKKANFIPLYFNNVNLKDIYIKRTGIIEFFLEKNNSNIEYDFSESSSDRNKIRLGILASHFEPQTETFATFSIYKHLNRELFEIILFTLNVSNHRLERYCTGHADALVQLPADLMSQVQIIREADLDILFISTNVTAVVHQITLLALHRLARLQIVDANSPVTTGMRHIDYYISSKLSEPEENAQQHYTETLVTLDSPPQCFDFATEEKILATTSISRESLGIAKTSLVYVSGANFYKIIPELEAAWTRIIASVPNSVLLLYPFNPNWSSSYPAIAFQKRIATTFEQHGIPQDRLILLDCAPNRADVKERLKLGDIYLDSYPYSGMTSLLDPLEVGLPTIVMETEFSRSRKGASLLRELQIPDLITNSEEAYIQLAVALGTNPELRQQKKDKILQKMQENPRFLDSRFHSDQMGKIFQELFQKHQAFAIKDKFKLRDINLIIFPDWTQSEELIIFDLERIIKALATHPDSQKTTLLIDISNIYSEDADLLLSAVMMNILMNEDRDVTEKLEISLVGKLVDIQWKALLSLLKARIVMKHENQQALAQVKAETLPYFEVESLSDT